MRLGGWARQICNSMRLLGIPTLHRTNDSNHRVVSEHKALCNVSCGMLFFDL